MNRLISKFSSVIIILALLGLIIQGDFFSSSPTVIIGQGLAVALLFSARFAFGKQKFNITADPADGPLVRRGPYRFIRHPMYTGSLLLIWVSVLGHWSIYNGIIGMVVLITIILRIAVEERMLVSRYPDYAEYQKQSKRIIPLVY